MDEHCSSWYDLLPIQLNSAEQNFVSILLVLLTLISLAAYSSYKLRNIETYIIPSSNLSIIVFFEIIVELFINMMKSTIGQDYEEHVPLIGSLGLFILFSNLLGLFPGFSPPTDNIGTTLTCGFIVFCYFNYKGFKKNGFNHIIHIANPIGKKWGWFLSPLLFPIEFSSIAVRPLSLGIRLAGNMLGDHKILFAFAGIMPLMLPIPFLILGLFVAIIQTIVFCMLSCVYISLHVKKIGNH